MLRERIVFASIVVFAIGVFVIDVVLLPGVILPGPPYFVPAILAAYFLTPRKAAGVAVLTIVLRILSDLSKQTPVWLMVLYLVALVLISYLSVQLSLRMRREAALAEERERLRIEAERRAREIGTIVESITDAVFVCDSQGRITLVNQAGLALVGDERAEDLGNLTNYMSRLQPRFPDGRPVPLDDLAISRALHGESARGREEIAINPTTHRRVDLLISAAPLEDEAGRVIGGVTVATDITHVKELTEETRHRAEQLATANRELEAFSYAVSHDLRAPLRHIDGFSKILLREYADKLDKRGREYLQFLTVSSQNMEQLIDALLKLSRVTRAEIRRQPVNLSEVAQSILAELQKTQPERQTESSFASGAVAEGDPALLRVVLENLLGNAWKFTSKRPVARIEFGVVRQGDKPVYYVKDNGAGFDMVYADKLFIAFQRLHKAEEFPGTGIGLATVMRIINRHGGRVWAEGEVDKGATFYFTLG